MYSFLFFVVFSVQVSLARVGLATCSTKSDCPESYFCHEKVCRKCLRCDMLFRKGNFCVTDFNDCKDCLEGYEEVLVTDFSNAVKPCKPVKKKVKLKVCENDNSCPQNTYCNEESCVKCFDCSLINRLPPVEKCAKGLNECGSCMIGFYEVAVTTETNYKPCEKDSFVVPKVPISTEMFIVIPVCVLITLIAAATTILSFKKYRDRSRSKTACQRPISPSAPPLYLMNSQRCIQKAEEVQSTFMGYVKEEKQQAKVFKQPDALYYYRRRGSEQLDNSLEGNNEGTRPSSWIPSESIQAEETNCSPGDTLSENFGLALSEPVIDTGVEQRNENNADENGSSGMNSIILGLINISQISENATNEETDILPETQNAVQEQQT